MSLESLYPYAGDHAIQNAVFALDFDGALSPDQIKAIKKGAIKELAGEFPLVEDQQIIAINIGSNQSAHQVSPSPQVGGFTMQRSSGMPNAFARSIVVTPTNALIVVNDYSRWDAVKLDVDRYLDALLLVVGKLPKAVTSIGLQYTDVFNWQSDPSELVLTEVFEAATPYMVPNVLGENAPSMWHSHHGYFVEHLEPVQYRQLDNINVSRIETSGIHSLQILTSHKVQFAAALWQSGEKNRSKISDIFVKLHDANKVILRALLTEQVREKIKLN